MQASRPSLLREALWTFGWIRSLVELEIAQGNSTHHSTESCGAFLFDAGRLPWIPEKYAFVIGSHYIGRVGILPCGGKREDWEISNSFVAKDLDCSVLQHRVKNSPMV
jgi:hypothetical protein